MKVSDTPDLQRDLEAILFVAAEPLSTKTLSAATGQPVKVVEEALTSLQAALHSRGVVLIQAGELYRLASAPETSSAVERYLGLTIKPELSKAALETLAIIAYRQPIKKSEIETIRGVASDQTIRNLLMRGLIQETGQADEPGRPLLYSTSLTFLQQLGLTHINQLPPLSADTFAKL